MLFSPAVPALLAMLVLAVGAASLPDPVVQETFSGPEGGPPAGWRVARGTWRVENGGLIADSLRDEAQITVGEETWQNYEVEVRATFLEVRDPKRWLSIVFRATRACTPPWSHFPIRKRTDDKSGTEFAVRATDSRWAVRARAKGPSATALGRERRLRVIVRGEQVTCFLDGAQVLESPFCVDRQRGCVGLAVSGCRARFDDFTVRRLPDTAVPTLAKGAAARVLCIAHRGFSAAAPENTLAAVRMGMEAGADGCEFDVATSRDGVAVLMHDGTVDRTTNGKGKVADLTAAQLAKLDAGSWRGKAFVGEPVPTLLAVLKAMKGTDCQAVIEIKADGIAAPIVEAVRSADMVGSSCVISFKDKALTDMCALEPRLPRVLVVGGERKGPPAQSAAALANRAAACKASILDLHYATLSPALITDLRRRGFKVWCWTVNDLPVLDALARWGVDGITTDRPDVMVQWRGSLTR
jgi:glycerophosphoryl diester phosphodiesterase